MLHCFLQVSPLDLSCDTTNDMDDLDNENASAHSFNKDNDKLVNKNASKNVRSVDASRQT